MTPGVSILQGQRRSHEDSCSRDGKEGWEEGGMTCIRGLRHPRIGGEDGQGDTALEHSHLALEVLHDI